MYAAGDVLTIYGMVDLDTLDRFVCLTTNDVIVCLGVKIGANMVYLTPHGIGLLPDDSTFHLYESRRLV